MVHIKMHTVHKLPISMIIAVPCTYRPGKTAINRYESDGGITYDILTTIQKYIILY